MQRQQYGIASIRGTNPMPKETGAFRLQNLCDIRLLLLEEAEQLNRGFINHPRKIMYKVVEHLRILLHCLQEGAVFPLAKG
jgi:hypothetical protein